ncbi:MAG TPA: DEAD/DEAH box helicase [Verrucomicrobiae bacterium]
MSFHSLGLDARILRAVTEAGYTEMTPIQSAAIPSVLAGQDVIGIAQTGTGKTAAFMLPILNKLAAGAPQARRGTKVLVLAPTRELAVQIEENARAYAKHLSLQVATVFGGVGEQPQLRALRAGTDVIVACPGRLLDLMGQRAADFSQLKFLVLDEADRMLDMGFLPSIRRIVQQLPAQRQTLLFSATLSKEIEALTHQFQRHPKVIQVGRRANPAETVTQLVHEVPKHLKTALLLHLLQDARMNMVLVFARMKHGADRLARQLEAQGVRTATLHSNRSQNQRLRALKDFKEGAVRVLVATDIAARGIDVDGISHVVNYDFPMHPEDYVHRIGRTGRAQAVGDAISFVAPDEISKLRSLERFIGRGLVRKKVEGFNYSQAAPAFNPPPEPRRFPRGSQAQRPQRQQRPQRSQHVPHRQFAEQSQQADGQASSSHPQRGSQRPFAGRPQPKGNARQKARPVSGNREGGNERHFPKPSFRRRGFRRPFGGY